MTPVHRSVLQAATELRQIGASRAQRRDVLLALAGYKASRLMLTDSGVLTLSRIGESCGLRMWTSEESYTLIDDPRVRGFSNTMRRCPAGSGRREVFFARDDHAIEVLGQRRDDPEVVGSHLRIPACCVEFYCGEASRAGSQGFEYSDLISLPVTLRASAFCNTFSRYFDRGLVDHFPCRHDCERTYECARESFDVLRAIDHTLAIDLIAEGTFIYAGDAGVFWLRSIPSTNEGWCELLSAATGGGRLATALAGGRRLEVRRSAFAAEAGIESLCGDQPVTEWFSPVNAVTFELTAAERDFCRARCSDDE